MEGENNFIINASGSKSVLGPGARVGGDVTNIENQYNGCSFTVVPGFSPRAHPDAERVQPSKVNERIQAEGAQVVGGQIGVSISGLAHGSVTSDISANRAKAINEGQIGGTYNLLPLDGGLGSREGGPQVEEKIHSDGASVEGAGSQIGPKATLSAGSFKSELHASGAVVTGGGRIGGTYTSW